MYFTENPTFLSEILVSITWLSFIKDQYDDLWHQK